MSGARLAIVVVVMVLVVMAVAWICIVRAKRTQRKSMIQRLLYYRDSYWGVHFTAGRKQFPLEIGRWHCMLSYALYGPNVYYVCMLH